MRKTMWVSMLLLVASGARAESFLVDSTQCLVRPRQVIQVGSPVFSVLAEVYVDRASVVKKGDILAKLNSTVEEAQLGLDRFRAANATAIEAARTELQWSQRELGRRQQLAGNMFSKANEIDEITTKADQARIAIRKAESDKRTAALEAERSQRQVELRIIRSPFDGVVTEMKLMPGEFVYETTPIMTLAQIDPLSVDLVIAAGHYRAVTMGMSAEVLLEAPMNEARSARVDAIDPVIDAASDTFRVRLSLPNPGDGIPAGIRCCVRFSEPAPGG
jgi:membrane fusion protein (multidrug efflux system)